MVDDESGQREAPVRVLGTLDAAFIVTGSIIGAGIFLVSGQVASSLSSPLAFMGVWLLGGIIALSGALSNGELGALFPRSGGEYVFLREAFSPALGFLSGWTSLWIAFPGSIATLAAGLGRSVAELAGGRNKPLELAVALGSVLLLTFVNALGLRPGKWVQNILSSAKLIAFAILLVLGGLFGHAVQKPVFFAPGDTPGGLASALVPVLFAYSGWNAATYVAGEIRDAQKSLGRALVIGTGLSVALYLALNAVYLKALTLEDMRRAGHVAQAAMNRLLDVNLGMPIAALIAVSVASSLQASVLVGPRILHAMAEDGLFFATLGRLHPKRHVPVRALFVQAGIASALLLSGQFEQLLTFTIFAIELFSALTVASVIALRIKRPDAPRAFRVPGYPVVPLIYVVGIGWVLWSLLASGAKEAIWGLCIVATGYPVYWLFHGRAQRARAANDG